METNVYERGMSTPLIIGGAILGAIVIGAMYYVTSMGGTDDLMMEEVTEKHEDTMMEDERVMEEVGDTMMEDEDAMLNEVVDVMDTSSYSGQVLAGTTAPMLVFNQADYNQAMTEGKLVVLYFYANWCPICRAEFPRAEAAFDQLTSDEVVGFRVNFNDNETDDDEVALARQFGVPYQHTKVLVQEGRQLLKSPEEWDTQRYIQEITSRL